VEVSPVLSSFIRLLRALCGSVGARQIKSNGVVGFRLSFLVASVSKSAGAPLRKGSEGLGHRVAVVDYR
jgi:hypothetical protein